MALEQNAVVRMTIGGDMSGETMVNVLHFRVKAVAGVAAPATGLAIIASAWAGAFDNQQSNAWNWRFWQALQVRGTGVTYSPTTGKPSGGQTFEAPINPPVPGTNAAEPLPPSTAFVISLRTGFAGKSKRGRAYIMTPTEGQNAVGAPAAAAVTAAQAAIDGFLATYGVGGGNPDWEMGVWSYRIATDRYQDPNNPKITLFGGNPQPALAFTGITTAAVDPQWGSMRSRSFIR